MIRYSTDMAYLYGFKDKSGYDREFKEGHPFKWTEKKGPILVKQKKGKYKAQNNKNWLVFCAFFV